MTSFHIPKNAQKIYHPFSGFLFVFRAILGYSYIREIYAIAHTQLLWAISLRHMRLLTILLLTTHLTLGQTSKVKLFSFQNSTCDEGADPDRLRTRIISKDLTKDILTIQIAATATCCVTFIPKTTYKNAVLDLDFEETGDECECGCCYEFTYKIKVIKNDRLKITLRGKEIQHSNEKYMTYPVQFKIVNGDTVNYIDKYGLRQGKWNKPSDSLMTKSHGEFIDNRLVRIVTYFPNGMTESEKISEKVKVTGESTEYFDYFDFNRYVEYYETGTKKKECHNNQNSVSNSYERGQCKEWNENGQLIYEGDFRK
jgi:hypothetical protein